MRTVHRIGATMLALLMLGGLAPKGAGAKTFSWPGYVTEYSGSSKIAVAHGGVHGVNASSDLYMSAYIRDPTGGGDPVYGRLKHQAVGTGGYGSEFNFGTGSTNSSVYVLKRISQDYADIYYGYRTRPSVCELRTGPLPNRCQDGTWKNQP